MDRNSNAYIYLFVLIMTVIVAVLLAGMTTVLKPLHVKNEAIFNKKAVLAAIESELGEDVKASKLPDDEVQGIFNNSITQKVIDINGQEVSREVVEGRGYKGGLAEHLDMRKEKKRAVDDRIFPVYIYNNNGKNIYIITVRGNGLWDEIWGNIALKEDFSTIVGVSFDHTGETAGLGAEIKDNPGFPRQFREKSIYNPEGEYTSVVVKKGGVRNPSFEVDAISGATVTCDGVSDMLYDGIKYYMPYFKSISKS